MSHFNGSRPITYSNPSATAAAYRTTREFESAAQALRSAEHVCILTGAGISAESGVPTFRDALTGLWAQFNAQELATPEAFARQPDTVWSWYAMRAAGVRAVNPNSGHYALATLSAHVPQCTLLTQNVDDLHERAGSTGIVALHGHLQRARCSAGCAGSFDMASLPHHGAPPCAVCGHRLRPDVVWFGEALPAGLVATARAATAACDVFLSVGTSNQVEPAASLPWLAATQGATVIVVNTVMEGQRKGPSILHIQGGAGATLSALVTAAFAGQQPRPPKQL